MQSCVPSMPDELTQVSRKAHVLSADEIKEPGDPFKMKWNTFGLLLILSTLYLGSTGTPDPSNVCAHINDNGHKNDKCPYKAKSTQSSSEDDLILLGTDGFIGYMTLAGTCGRNTINQATTTCSYSGQTNVNITVFPIDENQNCTGNCTAHRNDLGVSFTRNSPYLINISRSVLPTFACLFKGPCKNLTWRNWISNGCNLTFQDTTYFNNNGRCNMTCMNPTKTCENAKYDPSCSGGTDIEENKINTFEIKETASCFKCGSAFLNITQLQIPPGLLNIFDNGPNSMPNSSDSKKEIDAGTAAKAMKNISSILSLMENLTIASISIGSISGVLKKIESASEATDTAFIYSSTTGIKVIEDVAELKNYPNALIVPKEAAQKAFNSSGGAAFLGVFRFPNMSKDANNSDVLNNEVYAIEMGTQISNLSNTINLSFNKSQSKLGTPTCHSWDGSGNMPNWTTEGCNTIFNGSKVTCECEHLTFFAVLMAPPDDTAIRESDLITLTYITYIGCGLSMFFLGVGLFMHFLMRRAKASNSVHVLINLFMALFLLNLSFLANEYVTKVKDFTLCRAMAAFMHYCLLASFTWFGVEALHLCLQMTKNTVIKHYMLKISVAGWDVTGLFEGGGLSFTGSVRASSGAPPAFVVSVIFALGKYGERDIETERSNVTMFNFVHYGNTSSTFNMVSRMRQLLGGSELFRFINILKFLLVVFVKCWIVDSTVHYVVNIGYYCFIFAFTCGTFIVVLRWLTMLKLNRWSKDDKVKRSGTASSDVTTILGLCLLLGLTWSISFFSYGVLRVPSYYIFTILNSLQGFFLFMYYMKMSTFFGESRPTNKSEVTEETENPYEETPPGDGKKAA